MYEYGARNYDPAVGRFFNIDNYAEAFLDLTPYQYAGNNPVYFIDKNGNYIYVYDAGKTYRFDGGKLFGKDENDNWAVQITPEAGSFLEMVYKELKSMYEFDTGGGGSFGKSLLNYYNNDNINTIVINAKKPTAAIRRFFNIGESANFSDPVGVNYTAIGLDPVSYFGSNNEINNGMLAQIIIHELGHGILNINKIQNKGDRWLLNTKSEVFATYIENRFLRERNLPLRANYYEPDQGKNFIESSLLFQFNPTYLGNEPAIKNLQILNNFKQSLQTVPNTNFIFNN